MPLNLLIIYFESEDYIQNQWWLDINNDIRIFNTE